MEEYSKPITKACFNRFYGTSSTQKHGVEKQVSISQIINTNIVANQILKIM
jgi:hypothetical protein